MYEALENQLEQNIFLKLLHFVTENGPFMLIN